MSAARNSASEAAGTVDSAGSAHLEALWISWNPHRRTTGLCAAWTLPLRVIQPKSRGLRRRIEQVLRTIKLLRVHRPRILFIQNPSLALTLLALLARRSFSFYLVIDAHNEGVRPFDRPGIVVRWLTRRALRGADTTIVTNAALAADVRAAGGRPLVLSDSLPVLPRLSPIVDTLEETPLVAVIATFRRDEPIAAIMAAAALMPEVRFAFTGDCAALRKAGMRLPANVRLTGFLQDRDYWELLAQAAVICDLTLKRDCLVCGAYEALALAKPMVLSDDQVTREMFGSAAILTGSEPGEIAQALRAALEQRERLAAGARKLREAYRESWPSQSAAVWDAVLRSASASQRGAV